MARDPEINTAAAIPTVASDQGKPDQAAPDTYGPEPDIGYWQACLEDAERAERDWRKRGRDVVQIYRNEKTNSKSGKAGSAGIYFNILYSNTEVMLPAVYMKPPQPVVRSRFSKPEAPPPPPPMLAGMPPMGAPAGGPLPPPPGGSLPGAGGPSVPPPAPPGGLPLPPPGLTGAPPPGVPPVPMGPPAVGAPAGPIVLPPPGGAPMGPGAVPPPALPLAGASALPPPGPAQIPGPTPPGVIPQPDPKDVETAASVIEKALEIVVDDEHSHEAVKTALKDVLLPGRGVCRVRWKPQMKSVPLPGGPLPAAATPGAEPVAPTEERKVWETVDDEYVFWEDFLCDPVRQAIDTRWVAFRHLFAKEALLEEFADSSPALQQLNQAGKIDSLLKWTDESAAKNTVGGGSPMKSANTLGDHVRKAMVWEIWDRPNRRIIWFCRDATGLVLRIDPDVLKLQGFFPIPVPMLAVTTSDSRIPKCFYDLYAQLAEDLDVVSVRISRLTEKIKVRGAYNAASPDIADILTAGDGKMIPAEGVDLIQGGLQNHIWLVPIDIWMSALDKLFIARDQLKQQIYEVMGISDIMRGATRASETATAQRIKGSMGLTRLEDLKQQSGNFVRDLLRLKAEIICQNFDVQTLATMTGEDITPEVEAILRDDFMRTCSIDIEADSTVQVDEQAEQQSLAMVMQAIQGVMMGAQGMLQTGLVPPPAIFMLTMEMIKMLLHPIPYSRGVVELINTLEDQLKPMLLAPTMPGMPPPGLPAPGGPPPDAAASGPGGGPPKRPNGHGGPGRPPGAGTPPPLPGGPPGPPMM